MSNNDTGFALASCLLFILVIAGNLVIWGGLIYFVLLCLQEFGVIG